MNFEIHFEITWILSALSEWWYCFTYALIYPFTHLQESVNYLEIDDRGRFQYRMVTIEVMLRAMILPTILILSITTMYVEGTTLTGWDCINQCPCADAVPMYRNPVMISHVSQQQRHQRFPVVYNANSDVANENDDDTFSLFDTTNTGTNGAKKFKQTTMGDAAQLLLGLKRSLTSKRHDRGFWELATTLMTLNNQFFSPSFIWGVWVHTNWVTPREGTPISQVTRM